MLNPEYGPVVLALGIAYLALRITEMALRRSWRRMNEREDRE